MRSFLLATSLVLALVACNKVSEPEGKSEAAEKAPDPAAKAKALLKKTLEENKLTGEGKLVATITSSLGVISCSLYEDKAPATVENFVGLSNGTKKWKPKGGEWVTKPAYDGTTFHRVIPGFMIQGGDPNGDGSGEPGYVFADEMWPGSTHDRAGLLCMANRGPNTNGQQFFITDAAATQLDGYKSYTIFGECTPLDVVHKIATVPTLPSGEKSSPVEKPGIQSIRVTRVK